VFISRRLIEHIEACGKLPFDSIFASDHIPLFVDFNVFTLFGHPAFGTERAALRELQLNNPRLIDAYEESVCQQLENHNIEFRVRLLFQIKELEWNNRANFIFNKIDKDNKRAIQCAANKCRCTNHKKHPWSEQFWQATYCIRYWRKRMEIATLRWSSNHTTIFYMIASEIQCQAEIRKGKSMMNTELERQKGLITSNRRTLA
jgi:hypothetical protein